MEKPAINGGSNEKIIYKFLMDVPSYKWGYKMLCVSLQLVFRAMTVGHAIMYFISGDLQGPI